MGQITGETFWNILKLIQKIKCMTVRMIKEGAVWIEIKLVYIKQKKLNIAMDVGIED